MCLVVTCRERADLLDLQPDHCDTIKSSKHACLFSLWFVGHSFPYENNALISVSNILTQAFPNLPVANL